jgi:glycerol-3-phosphate cytidylyltransferase
LKLFKKTVITFGTFDLLHIGHINILERAKKLGNKLIVGVSSDALNYSKKTMYPVYSEEDRLKIIKSLKFVDKVFLEESLEKKREYILKYKADILVMGHDWKGKFDDLSDICKVIYLPRTENISTTEIKEGLRVL